MSAPIELSALDLSAMLCSKVCHDVINPVAAMENGFQLLEMDQKPESREEAMKLIQQSAVQATAKLKYARIAFGSSGSPTAQVDVGDAGDLGRQLFEPEIKVAFTIPKTLLAKNRVKLLLNMMLIAAGAVSRGGTMKVDPIGSGETMGFTVKVEAERVRMHPSTESLLAGTPAEALTAQTIQPFYTGLLAREQGMKLTLAAEAGSATLAAQ
ncbi:MAG: histidine phosphotransferase [Xanthobacteraceae bacterium]|nr:histidine phosphotransferase [Xanthobacteraceae bacterium]MCW5676789.1 histidine phosphotransferase [Xanthobacteraceae bacterium]